MTISVQVFFASASIFLLFFRTSAGAGQYCSNSSCRPNGPPVRFPFFLKDGQNGSCGFPGFNLSCKHPFQTILNLPGSGDFTVRRINYATQTILLTDPDNCLPNRFLNFTIPRYPFSVQNQTNLTFFNCTTETAAMYKHKPIRCLSGSNYSVWAIPTSSFSYDTVSSPCKAVKTVLASRDLNGDLELMWEEPDCGSCESSRGTCGFKNRNSLEIGCFNLPKNPLPRTAKYGITIGVGIPGLLFIIGLASYVWGKVKACGRRQDADADFSASNGPESMVVVTGLDGPTIESYPKTMVGESRRLPKPNDNTCAICLSEYQPKETLRTIPECKHYFHANCIDEWLRLNATCPVCRNSPDDSVVTVTPSSSSSSSSSLLSSQSN